MAVAANILWTGYGLMRRSLHGLMDHALPSTELAEVLAELAEVRRGNPGIDIHAIQTRESGRARFVSMHVLVPGSWTVARGHDLLEDIEARVSAVLPGAHVHTHLEPVEDPRSHQDGAGIGLPG
jgi:divalent metal cation (Fe/Co/Zn/Cd) transporter